MNSLSYKTNWLTLELWGTLFITCSVYTVYTVFYLTS